MRTHGFRGCVFASILIAPLAACAVTETWDGGGVNDFFLTSLNWADNTAPVSDLLNTDIVFAGALRRVPILFSPFSAHRITFDDSALSFSLQGAELSVGTGGIINESAVAMAFNTPVHFVANNLSVLAGTGGVLFGNTVTLPTTRLSVHGSGPTRFENVVGTAQIVKWDSGTMTWAPTAPIECELLMDSGTVVMESDGSTDVFTGAIQVIGDSLFRMDESVTLDGASLTQASGAILIVSTGATLTLQNGASVSSSGPFGSSGAHLVVTGTGSTLSKAAGCGVLGGGTLTVSAGGTVSTTGTFNIAGNPATAIVEGAGSSLTAGSLVLGESGTDGVLTFRNGATGSFGEMFIGVAGANGTDGTLNIQNGASVTATGNLSIATENYTQTGDVTITGT
jgi:T5SS/PEP-CTERM-associated repeat protein